MEPGKRINIWQELRERHVPKLVGFYLGASWVILEFIGFITDRYGISPYLIDLILLALGVMLPSVMVLAYTHGKPGKDEWTLAEKIVVPLNIILLVALTLTFFKGKDLGATTLTLSAEDEAGNPVERVVAKSFFTKRVALFYLNNNTGNPDDDWVGQWVPNGLFIDLIQDIYFDNRSPYQMATALLESGYTSGETPIALMRDIARRFHLGYFLSGTVKSASPFLIETQLYLTKGGRLVASHEYQGTDLAEIIDRASLDIKNDLDIPKSKIDESEDLPIRALSSGNVEALADFTYGLRELYFKRDWESAAEYLTLAVENDPTFAYAQFYLYEATLLLGRGAEEAIEAAMLNIYKVPVRLQGKIKEVYYLWQGEPERALSALSLDVNLDPDDVLAHRRLANFYYRIAQYEDALIEYREILRLNPNDDLILRDIAQAYSALGRWRDAQQNLMTYTRSNPRDTGVLIELGEIYQLLGKPEKANEVYERAALLGHNRGRVLMHKADAFFQVGDFEEALELGESAVDAARTPEVKLLALEALEKHFEILGRIQKAMSVAREAMPYERTVTGPMNSVVLRLSHFKKYTETTLSDSAFVMLGTMDMHLPDPWNLALDVVQVSYKLAQENSTISEDEIAKVDTFYSEYKFLVDLPHELISAQIDEHKGNYREAIQGYILTLQHYPRRILTQIHIAEVYRKMGIYEAAMESVRELLAIYPNDPRVLYELAQIQIVSDKSAALETLNRLAEIWSEADEIFLPAQKVNAELDRIPEV